MKQFFTWRDDWSLGVDLMDKQHRQLALLLNRMADHCLNPSDAMDPEVRLQQLHELMNLLYEKSRQHFDDEEVLMLEAGYSEHANHAREHRMLLAELKNYIREIEEERDDINMGVLMSLKHWFISHIIKSDKEFAAFLSSQTESLRAQPARSQRQAGLSG